MKRLEKIYKHINQKSQKYSTKELVDKKGFSAQEIANELSLLRNNVSRDLNELVRQNKVIKIKGRPVLYFDRQYFEKLMKINLNEDNMEIDDIESFINNKMKGIEDRSPFEFLIGADTSLKNQIEQAKAAILYPPNGLHTLIVGQTGVGKTLFANMMYSYGKFIKKYDEESPFIVFNCADYYNNPQLLLSQLFGHIKGAFTGADCEKEGLFEKASGGILFLDEIHRLPPEGQEMIFYFIDTGKYNKLGETNKNRTASVLIIGATTEEPTSVLLKTFIRRIPIMINIPSFEERTLQDKIDIIEHLLSKESNRVNKTISISIDAVKALIGSTSFGNVGQLKSNIQLICARGFLRSIKTNKNIEITLDVLPQNIKNGIISLAGKRKKSEEISYLMPPVLNINPNGCKEFIQNDEYELPFNLYKIIEDKVNILKAEGIDEEYINKFISTDINIHIKCLYDKFKLDIKSREKILKIVDKDILEFAGDIKELVEKVLEKRLNDRFLYAISLHLGSLIERIKSNINIGSGKVDGLVACNCREYKIALYIRDKIEERYNINVPEVEVEYLTLLLSSIQDEEKLGHVAIIVATHGNNTASSMVNVAKQLLGIEDIVAIDMPLEVDPKDTLNKMIEEVKRINKGKGVILLVDMGSLCTFGDIITEKTNIPVKTIDMVSTSIVLEAARRASIFDMELDNIYNSLKKINGHYYYTHNKEIKETAIITVCSTGEGTALKLKELIEGIIGGIDEGIKVIPTSLKYLNKNIEKISNKLNVIACVGVVNPNIGVPFISLESIIGGTGEKVLKSVLKGKSIKVKDENIVVKKLCYDTLNETLTYLNPTKVINILIDFINILEKELEKNFTNSMQVRIIIHVACSLERISRNEGLEYKFNKSRVDRGIIRKIVRASKIFEEGLKIKLTQDEIYFIADMIE